MAEQSTSGTKTLVFDPSKSVDALPDRPTGLTVPSGDGITINNDTQSPVNVFLFNGFVGPASQGYIKPGEKLTLPCAAILWEVFVQYENSTQLFIEWYSIWSLKVYYNKYQRDVPRNIELNVSQMHNA